MSTSYNTTITVYKGVPLVKGGTEVLYIGGSAAKGVLSAYAAGTYTGYYFERENRRYVQIDETYGNLDDVNYLSFENQSHGGKLYFAFVDHVVYINDNNTELEFTIDPFPTFIDETSVVTGQIYVVRNTLLQDIQGQNLQPDYLPRSAKSRYISLDTFSVSCSQRAQVIFAGKTGTGYPITAPSGYVTGIQTAPLNDTILQSIKNDGGTIIGCYMFPDSYSGGSVPIAENHGVLTGNPLAHMSSFNHEKLKSGVYTQVALATTNTFKTYELEDFANRNNVSFGIVYFYAPAFAIFIYPKNYKGVAENTSEGVYMQAPSLSISAQQGYSNAQISSDLFAGLMSGITGAFAGAAKGGVAGAVVGGLAGLAGGGLNMAKNAYLSKFNAREVTGSSVPITADDFTLRASLLAVSPTATDCIRIDDYFDYYGYNLEEMFLAASVNTQDGAYLQTGSEFLHGSEADDLLNARIMSGIKIRKTL